MSTDPPADEDVTEPEGEKEEEESEKPAAAEPTTPLDTI